MARVPAVAIEAREVKARDVRNAHLHQHAHYLPHSDT